MFRGLQNKVIPCSQNSQQKAQYTIYSQQVPPPIEVINVVQLRGIRKINALLHNSKQQSGNTHRSLRSHYTMEENSLSLAVRTRLVPLCPNWRVLQFPSASYFSVKQVPYFQDCSEDKIRSNNKHRIPNKAPSGELVPSQHWLMIPK